MISILCPKAPSNHQFVAVKAGKPVPDSSSETERGVWTALESQGFTRLELALFYVLPIRQPMTAHEGKAQEALTYLREVGERLNRKEFTEALNTLHPPESSR